jgi:hypothetical protein
MLGRTVTHYRELLEAVRDRVAELQISHEVLDSISGLPSGYCGKLLCEPPRKRMGGISLFLVLGALGLVATVREDTAAFERVRSRLERRNHRQVRVRRNLRMCVFDADFIRQRGRKGGLARVANQTPKQRRDSARHAAKARWQGHSSGARRH